MSYYIFVRRGSLLDEDDVTDQITYDEWLSLARADAEFEVDEDLSRADRIVFRWTGRSDRPAFHYFEDLGIGVNYFGIEVMQKIFQVATKLSADVQGEQGERYRMTERGVEQYWDSPEDGPPTLVLPIDDKRQQCGVTKNQHIGQLEGSVGRVAPGEAWAA